MPALQYILYNLKCRMKIVIQPMKCATQKSFYIYLSDIACISWIIFIISLTTTKTYMCAIKNSSWDKSSWKRKRECFKSLYEFYNLTPHYYALRALIKMIWHLTNMDVTYLYIHINFFLSTKEKQTSCDYRKCLIFFHPF